MDHTLNICSITTTGTMECGKVRLDKDQQKSLCLITFLLKPSGPPMIKAISLEVATQLSKLTLNFSELRFDPSLSREIIRSPFLTLDRSNMLSSSTTLGTL
jgi:hypothetical protein